MKQARKTHVTNEVNIKTTLKTVTDQAGKLQAGRLLLGDDPLDAWLSATLLQSLFGLAAVALLFEAFGVLLLLLLLLLPLLLLLVLLVLLLLLFDGGVFYLSLVRGTY